MLSQKFLENLHTAMAILVLFGQISGKFCLNFLPLILSASPNAHLFAYFNYACVRRKKYFHRIDWKL